MLRLIVALSVLCLVSGDLTDRIVNGRTVAILEFPYQASLQWKNDHFCGGSILNEKWILTAAHCLENYVPHQSIEHFTVRLGSTKWNNGGVVKKVEFLANHPKYDTDSMEFDIGLIRIVGKIVYSAAVKPMKLPSKLPASGACVVVSGWGSLGEPLNQYPEDLQAVELDFIPNKECISSKYLYGNAVLDDMVCAALPDKDSCQGDSGGPLVLCGTTVQVGVVSWGTGCAKNGYPGVFGDLTYPQIVDFIQSHVGVLPKY